MTLELLKFSKYLTKSMRTASTLIAVIRTVVVLIASPDLQNAFPVGALKFIWLTWPKRLYTGNKRQKFFDD